MTTGVAGLVGGVGVEFVQPMADVHATVREEGYKYPDAEIETWLVSKKGTWR